MKRLIVLFVIVGLFVSTVACENMKETEGTKETDTITKSRVETMETVSESVMEQKTDTVKRMIMIDGKLYVEMGEQMTTITCGTLDGHITSVVDKTQIPKKDGQANFGSKKIGYQIAGDGGIVVYINKKWMRFEPEN